MSPYSYHVSWAGHRDNLQAACERHFLDESLVDVTLAVGAGLVKCHRVVLSAASAYFRQLLAQHPCPHPIIFMRDMDYWEVLALVDFMYRGEVGVEEGRLEQLMRAAETLQIHGLSSCLRACLNRTTTNTTTNSNIDNNSDANNTSSDQSLSDSGGELQAEGVDEVTEEADDADVDVEVDEVTALSRLCELNGELELRPISPPTASPRPRPANTARSHPQPRPPHRHTTAVAPRNKDTAKETEIVEENTELPKIKIEPDLIQEDYKEHAYSAEKVENSDFTEAENEDIKPIIESQSQPHPDPNLMQFRPILPRPANMPPRQHLPARPHHLPARPNHLLHNTNLYKRYSPRVLEQAVRDLHTGKFQSIRACAKHHGIPMTTLRYRSKIFAKKSQVL